MNWVEGNFSNMNEPQKLDCVCGNSMSMPNNASWNARFCKCPKCGMPFEFHDGVWLTVAPATTTIRIIGAPTEIEYYIIDLPEQQDRSPSVVSHIPSPPNSPPTHSVDHPLLRGPSELHDGGLSFTILPTGINNRESGKAEIEKASNQIQLAPMTSANALESAYDLLVSKSDTADNLQSTTSVVDINSNAIQPTTRKPHDCIRDSIRESLNLANVYPENVALSISLACHPWPDTEISADALKIIASELRPGLSLNHPSILEIACDRLLRLQEASQFEGYFELASFYGRAASCILSHIASVSLKQEVSGILTGTHTLINDPLGAQVRKGGDKLDSQPKPCKDNIEFLRTTVISLLGAAIFRGSFDTGIAIGGAPTGVSVNDLAMHLNVDLPHKEFDEWIDSLDERSRDILRARTQWLVPSNTLVEVAERWKITRERVRQIELKITEKLHNQFADIFKRLGRQMFSPLGKATSFL
jgi:hypothetical protein